MQEILEVKQSAQTNTKASKNAAKGDAELFTSELEAASAELEAQDDLLVDGEFFNTKNTKNVLEKLPKSQSKLSLKDAVKLNLLKQNVEQKETIKTPLNQHINPKTSIKMQKNAAIKQDSAKIDLDSKKQLILKLAQNEEISEKIINSLSTNKKIEVKHLEFSSLSKALKISDKLEKIELNDALEKLEKITNKLLTKLDSRIKQSAKTAVKEPSILKDLLISGLDTKSKIKDLINDAKTLNEALPKRLQISKEELLESIKIELAQDKSYGKELLDDLSFTKMLDLAQTLKSGGQAPDLNALFKLKLSGEKSSQISSLAASAKNVKELINNLKDELAVSKMTFERINNEQYNPQIFKNSFPKLYDDGFFATTLSAAIKAQPNKSENAAVKLSKQPNLAKKALGIEKIDLDALKSGKLNELLNASKEQSANIKNKLDLIEQKEAQSPSTQAFEIDEETSLDIKPSSEHTIKESTHASAKMDLKTAFVSGDKLNKEQTKAVIDNFAQDFKDELAKFKAPIHKVSIALKPAELGEINVTMMARGNNLQVNLQTANTSTMNMFMQNQSEIRTALVNMGFTGLSMNFSSNGEGGKNQQQDQRRKGRNDREEADENTKIETSGINFTLERYL